MLTKTLNGLWIAFVALTLMLSAALPAFAAGEWSQGFEVDTSGWFDESDYAGYGDASRVPSGTDGIASSEGGFHAVFTQTGSGPFSRFDGYRDTWPGEWAAEIDVYLDPAAWSAGEGFDYSVAATANGGGHLQDFIFHVTKDTSTGDLMVGGSNNTNFDPREDLENINHYVVTSAGWYTLQHVFRDNAGVLEVDMNLVDDTDSVLFTETRTTPANLIPSVVGGNRYAWFTNIDVDGGIAVDNHELNVYLPDEDEDGVSDGADLCPASVDDEPSKGLGSNQWIWNGDSWETEVRGKGNGPEAPAETLEDTYGCGCFDILDQLEEATGLDFDGHYKKGCSKSVIEDWIAGEYYMGPTLLETVEVPADDADGVSSVETLNLDTDYFLKAYGTAYACNTASCMIEMDAEYSTSNASTWVDGVAAPYDSYGTNLLDLMVDGGFVDWGAYNVSHEYQIDYAGTGSVLDLQVNDIHYPSNSGSLYVDIIEDKWVDLW